MTMIENDVLPKVIRGSGGGDAGGSARIPIEDPDTLLSRAMVTAIDMLGEGEIGGLIDGGKSIFFNDTPLQNDDGTFNFANVEWDTRNGTQNQLPFPGISDVETPYSVGVRVRQAAPAPFTISNPNVDAVRVIVTIPALSRVDTATGDTHGAKVSYKFQVSADGGAFVDVEQYRAWRETGGDWWSLDSGWKVASRVPGSYGIAAGIRLVGASPDVQNEGHLSVQPQIWQGGQWVDYGKVQTTWVGIQGYTNELGGDAFSEVYGPMIYAEAPDAEKIRFKVVSQTTTLGATTISGVTLKSLCGEPEIAIKEKTRSRYQCEHVVNLPKPATGWVVRMVRLTEDSASSSLANDTYLDSYIEIINARMIYPNTALCMAKISAEQFSQVPRRSYLVGGLYIKVPSNYNAATRQYTGVWNGTFIIAVSSNPAWILYDVLTNKRYGLGQFISEAQVDKAALYKIGRYCDEMVDDGYGGQEPRFAINTVINSRTDAYKVISDLTSVFRGMAYWSGGMVGFTQDAPEEPSMLYNAANVIDGIFQYQGSARKDRHSVALITWNDPAEGYKQKTEYVEDQGLIDKYGIRKVDMVAFGCVSRGQANRLGQWILYTEQYEGEIVSFKVGLDSALVVPGEVIKVHDQFRAGKRMGGRLAASTLNSATLDAPVTFESNGASISIMMADGSFVDRTLDQGIGTFTALTWAEALPALPLANALWICMEPNLQPFLARVIGIAQSDTNPGEFGITAMKHNPLKYESVEGGLTLTEPVTSTVKTKPDPVDALVATEEIFKLNDHTFSTRLHVSWSLSQRASRYVIEWRKDDEKIQTREEVSASIDIDNVPAGTYTISVRAVNALGLSSLRTTITHVVSSNNVAPDVLNLRLASPFVMPDANFVWDNVPGGVSYYVEVWAGGSKRREATVYVPNYTYSFSESCADGGPHRVITLKVKATTVAGVSTNFATLWQPTMRRRCLARSRSKPCQRRQPSLAPGRLIPITPGRSFGWVSRRTSRRTAPRRFTTAPIMDC